MYRSATCVLFAVFLAAPCPPAQKKKPAKPKKIFTLENLFPPRKKPLFGPRARGMKFSHDSRWAAWLWRPYRERRHGNDLWILDVASGKVTRVTSAAVMAEFQAAARAVVEDRAKKAKKAAAGKGHAKKQDGRSAQGALGARVSDKDATDEKAPRYGGVTDLTWSPAADELLFTSAGDVYRLRMGGKKPERLTRTKKRERSLQYLPGGKGYTYMVDDALMEVRFGSHLVRELDPALPSGEKMAGYELSPDGKKLVFVTRKGKGRRGGDRKVKIAQYRKRFMEVREVPRHVSDDPYPPTQMAVYVYDLEGALRERHEPVEVFRRDVAGPRDILRVPEWSPDSKKVTFSVFEQKTGHVTLLVASLPPTKLAAKKPAAKRTTAKKPAAGELTATKAATSAKKKPQKHPAKVVYRWLHDGGPNTPRMMQPKFLADSRRIVFLSEATGFRHLHVLDPVYATQAPVTTGRYEVYPLDLTKDHRTMFVAATKEAPSRRDIYAVDLDKRTMKRLTCKAGAYDSAAVSPDARHVLATFSRFGALRELVAVDVRHESQRTLTSSHPARTKRLTATRPEFFSYVNRHGQRIHGCLFKPDGWRKSGKRPLLIYVYGGPLGTRKNVVEGNYSSDGYFFNLYMAREHGYLTAMIDPRGMSGYGGLFEKANFDHPGKPQVEDLTDGVHYLVAHYGADPKRVGIHGWSFGGFQTQMCLYTAPEVFQVGIAGAGPTEWENYNSWYSTGTIGKSRTGHTDLAKFSLLDLAKNLRGKLLLIHGMEDSNVLYQDTVRVYRKLLDAGKETQVELFLDPTGGHGLGGDVKRLNKARKYEGFLLRTLGEGRPEPRRNLTVESSSGTGPATGRDRGPRARQRPSRSRR